MYRIEKVQVDETGEGTVEVQLFGEDKQLAESVVLKIRRIRAEEAQCVQVQCLEYQVKVERFIPASETNADVAWQAANLVNNLFVLRQEERKAQAAQAALIRQMQEDNAAQWQAYSSSRAVVQQG